MSMSFLSQATTSDWIGSKISALRAMVFGCNTEAVEAFIDEIVGDPLTDEQIRENFYIFSEGTANFRDADVIMLGERHDDPESLLLREKALQSLVSSGDFILNEGEAKGGCSRRSLFHRRLEAMKAQLYRSESKQEYDVIKFSYMDNSKQITAADCMLASNSQKLSKLSVSRAVCGGWDHDWSFYKMLQPMLYTRDRNAILAKCIKNVTECVEGGESFVGNEYIAKENHKPRLFVLAGELHTPWGERRACLELARLHQECRHWMNGQCVDNWGRIDADSLSTKSMESFYSAFSLPQFFNRDWAGDCGSTEPIFKALKERSYAVLIPKKVFDAQILKKAALESSRKKEL